MLPGAKQDASSMTPQWERVNVAIEGVQMKRTRHVVTANSITTELYRADWAETAVPAGHVILVALDDGRISAWHMHATQTDGGLCRGRTHSLAPV